MSLREKLGRQFVITSELGPVDGTDVASALENVKKYLHLDAINIHDCPMARLRINSIALAQLIQAETGIETVPHFTCRDRSLLGTQADLLGAHAQGIKNILPTTGDPPSHGPYESKAVYDLNTISLMQLIKKLNQGLDANDKEFKGPTDFFVSATASPVATNMEGVIGRIKTKIEAGANFLQTQPVYDADKTIAFMDKVRPLGIPVVIGIMPLKSLKMAEYMRDHVTGIEIPEQVISQLKDGKTGAEIASELVEKIYKYVDGIHIMALGDIMATNKIIEKTLSIIPSKKGVLQ